MKPICLCLAICILVAAGCEGKTCPEPQGYLVAKSFFQRLDSPSDLYGMYTEDTKCSWRIISQNSTDRIYIRITKMDLEAVDDCSYDSLTIRDTDGMLLDKLCGSRLGEYTSRGSSISVVFETDGSIQQTGFSLDYRLLLPSEGPVTTVAPFSTVLDSCPSDDHPPFLVGDEVQIIQSENYPRPYPNGMNCKWIIQAMTPNHLVKVNVVDLSLEVSSSCSYDYLSAYDSSTDVSYSTLISKLCGSSTPVIFSTGRYLTLVFHSDSSQQSRGFKVEVSQAPGPEGSSSSASQGVVIGTVAAIIFVTFIVVVCVGCFIRARVAASRRRSRASRRTTVSATQASRFLNIDGVVYHVPSSSVDMPPSVDPSTFAPPPYPGPPLPKDDPPPYWMAAMYTVDSSAQLPKPEGHLSGEGPSASEQTTPSVEASAPAAESRDSAVSGATGSGEGASPTVGTDNRGYVHEEE